MKQRSKTSWVFSRSFLVGGMTLLLSCRPGVAGQPIQFSNPKTEVDLPTLRRVEADLPKPSLKWDTRGPEEILPMPPPIMPDPAIQREWRERQEQKRHWLTREPDFFKDRFKDPFEKSARKERGPFQQWDDTVDRVFGKSDPASTDKADGRHPLPLSFPEDMMNGGAKKSGRANGWNGQRSEESPNSVESNVKAIFGPAPHDPRATFPGQTLTDLVGNALSDEKREHEDRRREFRDLLNHKIEPQITKSTDSSSLLVDLTRTPVNPITPGLSETLPVSVNPLALPKGPEGPEVRLRSKSPFDNAAARFQPAEASTVPKPEDKNRQLESLKLMTRPGVLSFPGRQY